MSGTIRYFSQADLELGTRITLSFPPYHPHIILFLEPPKVRPYPSGTDINSWVSFSCRIGYGVALDKEVKYEVQVTISPTLNGEYIQGYRGKASSTHLFWTREQTIKASITRGITTVSITTHSINGTGGELVRRQSNKVSSIIQADSSSRSKLSPKGTIAKISRRSDIQGRL